MRIPRFASVLLVAGCLVTYLMFVKRHYDGLRPALGHREPAHYRPTPAEVVAGGAGAGRGGGARFQYGVMFDAGSTGTRVHVFKFQVEDNEAPTLAHETFKAIKPGLSAYADDPEKCEAGIMELLAVAQDAIPAPMWSRSPLVLKATAGLRLLPGEKATHLLDRVRAVFAESPFVSRDDSVSIMDGTDEGISAWITVNFLTGGLHGVDTPTVGMLDLGGGSTQITFSPQDEKTIQTSPIDYISSVQMFNYTHTLYSHSYLGLGLMSARLAVLGGVEGQPLGGSSELVSPCLPPEYTGPWEHADTLYTVRGQKEGEPVYESCLRKVEKVLYRKVVKATEVDVDFYAFSYYYDRAVDLEVIDEKKGGTIKVSDYMDAAKRVCNGVAMTPVEKPFLCLDLTYISVLLQELGFPTDKEFKLARTINDVETSWALGATFHYIESLRNQ